MRHRVRVTALTSMTVVLASASCVPDASRQERLDQAYLRLVAAEDARPTGGRELAVLIDATGSDRVFLRRTAVRALGRLENPDLVEHIEPLLTDGAPTVREMAAHALAQSHVSAEGSSALRTLLERAAVEIDPQVRGTLARSMGRLTLSAADRQSAADALVDMSRIDEGPAPTATLLGVALGLEALVRHAPGEGIDARVAARLEELVRYRGRGRVDPDAPRIRALALLTLGQARRITDTHVDWALEDQATGVAATGLRYLDAVPPALRDGLLGRGVSHGSTHAVIEAISFVATQPRDAMHCLYLLQGAAGPSPGAATTIPASVRVIAIDALADPCPDAGAQRAVLTTVVGELAVPGAPWQPAAHALVTLARTAPAAATAALPDFSGHSNPFVRSYAARAAAALGNTSVLRALVEDEVANVRTEAVRGLSRLNGRDVDDLLVGQLGADDSQLLMTVAALLEGSNSVDAPGALLEAFERISEERRETRRDARRALVARIAELGDPNMSDRLEPYLTDYDPLVAEDVATTLQGWTGRPFMTLPNRPPRAALPTVRELRAMDGASVILHMEGGGTVEIELHPYESTTSTFRFVRLVREGYFDGLTFHRWAPNFVIQGGSPGANEYEGDGAFARDEVGLRGHWRGTVGISTRGHDTGDGQIFVNLLDNVRLDHTFTIVGTVTAGMDVVDAVLEGAVIERAEVRARR